ncbi:DUF4198 domain-containing protein, partial [Azospirillum sp. B4]|uniref:DUF4198 domain-containing protein n=1 Tax=Azospirillum sp. B4 TaxID=95605 RepID=UPI000679B039
MGRKGAAGLVSVLALTAGMLAGRGVQAHTPYLLPNQFAVTGARDHVTVESSFTEDFFTPDVVLRSDAFAVVLPSGAEEKASVTYLRDMAVFEAALPEPGTYRLTTGERLGRKGRMVKVNGDWRVLGEDGDKTPPAGAEVVDYQSVTRADAYVSKGAPTTAVVAPTGHGLEFVPQTHPNQIDRSAGLAVRVLFDGKPLAGQTLTLYRAGTAYDDAGRKGVANVTSGADGTAVLRPDRPGLYLVMGRYRTHAPAGS